MVQKEGSFNKNDISGGMPEGESDLGLIAGGGRFPLLVADAAKARGLRVVAVAHRGETDQSLAEKVDEIEWINLGQLGHLIKALKKNGVYRAIMAGTIKKRRIFENVSPDVKGLTLMSKIAVFHDDSILRTLAEELAKEGIKIVSSTFCLPELFVSSGCLTRRKPNKEEEEDIRFGWRIAKELGHLDIGQCVVVRKKTVVALEAIEGTDAAILRGGNLAKEGAVVVKVSKPAQDLRFDLPTVGIETLRTMLRAKSFVLAIEAGKTLMFDKEEMLSFADNEGICIVSRED